MPKPASRVACAGGRAFFKARAALIGARARLEIRMDCAARDPEKWFPFFGQDHAPTQHLEHDLVAKIVPIFADHALADFGRSGRSRSKVVYSYGQGRRRTGRPKAGSGP